MAQERAIAMARDTAGACNDTGGCFDNATTREHAIAQERAIAMMARGDAGRRFDSCEVRRDDARTHEHAMTRKHAMTRTREDHATTHAAAYLLGCSAGRAGGGHCGLQAMAGRRERSGSGCYPDGCTTPQELKARTPDTAVSDDGRWGVRTRDRNLTC